MKLNRRHKAGLFLVLVAAGLSLLFEASGKQIAGVVLLGMAGTWLFGSLSLRVLGFVSCSLACVIGLYLAVFPIIEARNSYLEDSKSYDSALAQIRAAVAKADVWEIQRPPPTLPANFFDVPCPVSPKGSVSERVTPAQFSLLVKQKYPEYADLEDAELGRRVVEKYPRCAEWIRTEQKEVILPDSAQKWLTPKPSSPRGSFLGFVTIPFPADATDDAIMAELQSEHLVPRPTFSVVAAISANRRTVFSGAVLLALGLLGFAGMLWRERKRKRIGVSPS